MTPVPSGSRPLVVLDALLVNRQPTGVGRSILELLPAMARIDRGLDFLVLATEPDLFASLAEAPGWRVLPCPGAAGGTVRKALFTQRQVPRICRAEKAHLLHSLQFIAPLRLPCPSVVTVHDLAWLRFPDTVEQPRRSYYRFFVPRTLQGAAAIVTNSQATARDTAHFYPEVTGRVQPTLFGTPSWVWDRPTGRKPNPGSPFFLFVGTLEPRKNLANLLTAYQAFRQLPAVAEKPDQDIPRLVFIGGKGWKDSPFRGLMQDLENKGWLEVLGYRDPSALWELYRSARALLFPSRHEGFGFPILEAQAAGLPVMTANRGAMAEVGGDGVLAVVPEDVPALAQGMGRLAWDQDLWDDLSRRGPDLARQWTWERTAEETCAVYRTVLQEPVQK